MKEKVPDVELDAIHPDGQDDGSDIRVGDFGSRYGREQKWWQRREVLLVAGGAAAALLVIVVAGVSSSSCDTCTCIDDDDGKAVGGGVPLSPLPKPATFCEGGGGGILRRLSRQAFSYWQSTLPPPDRSLIVMLADGYGPSIHTMARDVGRNLAGNATRRLALDDWLVGSAFTGPIGTLITDSAAGATAYSTGRKTFNGALNVVPASQEVEEACVASFGGSSPVGEGGACARVGGGGEACCPVRRIANLMEGCKARGMATGIVVTTVLPHATPAAWSSHSANRNYYDFIAQQQLQSQPPIDVLLGGGAKYYDGRRGDGRDLVAEYAGTAVYNRDQLLEEVGKSGEGQAPLLGLFADDNMDYEVDRVNGQREGSSAQPSLAEMTRAAIRRLKATNRPYCLLVEGSRIDHALHGNDVASAAHDALAYDDMVREVVAEVEGPSAVEMLSVADHSTGGLTLGMQETFDLTYANGKASWSTPYRPYRPEVLAGAKMSTGLLASRLCCVETAFSSREVARDFVDANLGLAPSDGDLSLMEEAKARESLPCTGSVPDQDWGSSACALPMQLTLNRLVQRESGTKTTTSGHTAEDIHVYAAGSSRGRFVGAMENNEVGSRHLDLLGFDVGFITDALNECQVPVHPVE